MRKQIAAAKAIPVAKAGDVCILVEPGSNETGPLQTLQQHLQHRFGGRLHQRPHFTCQRFSPESDAHLTRIIEALRLKLTPLPPLPVTASELVLAQHPFWGFAVLRWELHLTEALYHFSTVVDNILAGAGLPGHYPSGEAWSPHVTALEEIYQNGHRLGVQSPSRQFLYHGRQIVLSQVRPGKQFEIVGIIPLANQRFSAVPGPMEFLSGFARTNRR